MRVTIPVLEQTIVDDGLYTAEKEAIFEIDTSVYSEERWEKNFPELAAKEGLFQYAERIRKGALTDRVLVSCMLKAIYCFVESEAVPTYKSFAQLFNLAVPSYTEKLISKLKTVFELILNGSATKN